MLSLLLPSIPFIPLTPLIPPREKRSRSVKDTPSASVVWFASSSETWLGGRSSSPNFLVSFLTSGNHQRITSAEKRPIDSQNGSLRWFEAGKSSLVLADKSFSVVSSFCHGVSKLNRRLRFVLVERSGEVAFAETPTVENVMSPKTKGDNKTAIQQKRMTSVFCGAFVWWGHMLVIVVIVSQDREKYTMTLAMKLL